MAAPRSFFHERRSPLLKLLDYGMAYANANLNLLDSGNVQNLKTIVTRKRDEGCAVNGCKLRSGDGKQALRSKKETAPKTTPHPKEK